MLDIPNARGSLWLPDAVDEVHEHAMLHGCRVRLVRRDFYSMRKLFFVNERLCELHVTGEYTEKSDRLVEFQIGNLRRKDVFARIFRAQIPSQEPVHFIVPTAILNALFHDDAEVSCYMPLQDHASLKFYHRLWLLYREAWTLL